jgi:two-component system sensor histidine kinase ChiS
MFFPGAKIAQKSGQSLFILFFLLSVFSSGASGEPISKNGRLVWPNSSSDPNKPDRKPIALDGEWEFYWKQFIDPGTLRARESLPSNYWSVPNIWNTFLDPESETNQEVGGMGFATYRLVIESEKEFLAGIKIPDLATAYRVFWNGKLIASAGKVGKSKEEHTPQYYLSLEPITMNSGENELIVHVSNFSHYKGGIWEKIRIGEWDQIRQDYLVDLASELFLAGAILIMAIYHMGIYILRRSEKTALFFSLFCLFITLRILTVGERFLFILFPGIPWEIGMNLEYNSYYFAPIFFLLFVRSVYTEYTNLWLIRISVVFTIFYSALLILLPATIYPLINTGFHLGTIFMILQGSYAVARALFAGKQGSLAFTLGLIPIVISTINDILFSMLIVQTFQMISIGLFLFIFSQSFMLSMKFAKAFSDVEKFSKRLVSLDKLKDEFLANTSHELRTPLNGIIGIAESMIDGAAGKMTSEQKYNLSMIISSGRRLASLVNDILDFSKMKNRDLLLNTRPTSLHSLIQVVLETSRPIYSTKNLEIRNEVSPHLPKILGDEMRIQQILYNVIGNSIKFTDTGYVRITASVLHSQIQVTVEDSGIGIPSEKLEDIFLSFEQADSSAERNYGGTGLGLAITKKLIELHGGEIWAESVLGIGSKFHFTFLIADSDEAKSKSESQLQRLVLENRNSGQNAVFDRDSEDWNHNRLALDSDSDSDLVSEPSGNMSTVSDLERDSEIEKDRFGELPIAKFESGQFKILIVDDEPINRQVLKNHLKIEDYHLEEASSGVEALQFIDKGDIPDLIILDVMMPIVSGYEVCSRIRKTYSLQELPILLLTAKNQILDIVTGLEKGANDYLSKPFDKRELLTRVKNLLILRKAVQEQAKYIAYQNELSVAKNLQSSILPEVIPEIPGIEFAFEYTPMEEVGGDFFDFHILNEDRFGIIIADVSGHGVPAALVAAMFKIASSIQFEVSNGTSEILSNINKTLFGKTKRAFVTASYIEIDLKTKTLSHSRAGHPPLLILDKTKGEVQESLPTGMMIGFIANPNYGTETISLPGNQRVCLYTDGIIEARNPAGELYSMERFIEFLRSTKDVSARDVLSRLREELNKWTKNSNMEDDLTLILVDID